MNEEPTARGEKESGLYSEHPQHTDIAISCTQVRDLPERRGRKRRNAPYSLLFRQLPKP